MFRCNTSCNSFQTDPFNSNENKFSHTEPNCSMKMDYSYFNGIINHDKTYTDLNCTKTELLTKLSELEVAIRGCRKIESSETH